MKSLFFTFFTMLSLSFWAQSISGKFTPAKQFKWAMLYQMHPDGASYVNGVELDSLGAFTFPLDSSWSKGLYSVIYNLPQESHNFEVFYDGSENVQCTFDTFKGLTFEKSDGNKLLERYYDSISTLKTKIDKLYFSKKIDTTAIMNVFSTLKNTQHYYELATKDNIVYPFIIANKTDYPSFFEPYQTYREQTEKNFFKYIDFSNELIQSSSFVFNRVRNYIFQYLPTHHVSIDFFKNKIDCVVKATQKASIPVQRNLLEFLWQALSYQYDEATLYLGNTYLLPISKQLKDTILENKIMTYNKVAIGQIAPDFEFNVLTSNKEILQKRLATFNQSKRKLLVFWSSTCSHCIEEIPKLHEFINSLEASLKPDVIALGLENSEDKLNWENVILTLPNFTHSLLDNKWENKIVKEYSVQSTPSYFVLDANNIILSKPLTFDTLKSFLNKK